MSSINDFMTAICDYEHRDAKGCLVSVGRTKIDWTGKIHAIQKNLRTGEIVEAVFYSDGKLKNIKHKTTFKVKLLRLVGLKRK